jgi:hypothetical protein
LPHENAKSALETASLPRLPMQSNIATLAGREYVILLAVLANSWLFCVKKGGEKKPESETSSAPNNRTH